MGRCRLCDLFQSEAIGIGTKRRQSAVKGSVCDGEEEALDTEPQNAKTGDSATSRFRKASLQLASLR
eukprot:6202989-Pleurochrysis_carterae.AAC.3